jgi:hypothetical protein
MLRIILTRSLLTAFLFLASFPAFAQDDLLDLLDSAVVETPVREYTEATFKTTRVITSRSIETPGKGEMQFLVAHRFGRVNGGWREFFGLDQANIRLDFEYGVTDWLSVGWGRSNVFKQWDGFARAKFLRQSTGLKKMPITAEFLASVAMNSGNWTNTNRENYISSRASYVFQLMVARKFSRKLSLQVMGTMVHKNLVTSNQDKNDQFMVGSGGRFLLTGSFGLTAEYHYLIPNRIVSAIDAPMTNHSFSLGFDLETGGHVFQIMATNNLGMTEHQYFTSATTGKWTKGDIHIGFNINRVFTLANYEKIKQKKDAKRMKKEGGN